MALIPTASQTVGPYLHLGLTQITFPDIAKDASKGETILITGRVLDGETDITEYIRRRDQEYPE